MSFSVNYFAFFYNSTGENESSLQYKNYHFIMSDNGIFVFIFIYIYFDLINFWYNLLNLSQNIESQSQNMGLDMD